MIDDDDSASQYDGPSRSQLRREALDVLKIAQTLADLSDAQLSHFPLDDELLAEVRRARAVTQQIARKRQIQFLAKQLRRLDDDELEPIRAKLDNDRQQARMLAAAMHRTEKWRDRLLAEGDDALTELLNEFPDADRQNLRQILRQARTERDQNRPPQMQRELFRVLRELMQS